MLKYFVTSIFINIKSFRNCNFLNNEVFLGGEVAGVDLRPWCRLDRLYTTERGPSTRDQNSGSRLSCDPRLLSRVTVDEAQMILKYLY